MIANCPTVISGVFIKCGEEIDDQFDKCWRCSANDLSDEDRLLIEDEFVETSDELECAQCGTKIANTNNLCPNCGAFSIKTLVKEKNGYLIECRSCGKDSKMDALEKTRSINTSTLKTDVLVIERKMPRAIIYIFAAIVALMIGRILSLNLLWQIITLAIAGAATAFLDSFFDALWPNQKLTTHELPCKHCGNPLLICSFKNNYCQIVVPNAKPKQRKPESPDEDEYYCTTCGATVSETDERCPKCGDIFE